MEAAKLTWNQIDLKAKTLTITDTKNHDTHTLPLSTYLQSLLSKRKEYAKNQFVFPAPSASGHIIEPRKQIGKVIEHSGVTSHRYVYIDVKKLYRSHGRRIRYYCTLSAG